MLILPILFCSGSAEQEDKDEARLAGAQGYLVKPVGMDDLIAEIVRLIKEAKVAWPVEIVVASLHKKFHDLTNVHTIDKTTLFRATLESLDLQRAKDGITYYSSQEIRT